MDAGTYVLLDVRSPSEYEHGHIPGAVSLPLFSDDERAAVGTAYKHEGPDAAMRIGLAYVGPRMPEIVGIAERIGRDKRFVVHCWRGGKRSASIGWLLQFAGFDVSVLEGGYKAYRNALRTLVRDENPTFTILGGETGSRKTEVLRALALAGEQVLDLEALAEHKGSAFGWIGERPQPSTEQFENRVFCALANMDFSRRIWVENESRSIGRVFIPETVWEALLDAPLIHLEVPRKQRVRNLVETYATGTNNAALSESFVKITRRLGGQHVARALEAIEQGDYAGAAEIALTYYDKTYAHGLERRRPSSVIKLACEGLTADEMCDALIKLAEEGIHQATELIRE